MYSSVKDDRLLYAAARTISSLWWPMIDDNITNEYRVAGDNAISAQPITTTDLPAG